MRADSLSRTQDNSAICLTPNMAEYLFEKWGYPQLDCFAYFAGANEGEHKASVFFSKFESPGATAVDGLSQDWQRFVRPGELVYCFPLFDLIPAVLRKIEKSEVNTILILPNAVKSWTPLLNNLPIADEQILEPARVVNRLGAHVPKYIPPTFEGISRKILIEDRENLPQVP